jgi:hypothetical protein
MQGHPSDGTEKEIEHKQVLSHGAAGCCGSFAGKGWKIMERPILFNGEMVRAILSGRKTQTRRIVKPQPPDMCEWDQASRTFVSKDARYGVLRPCPYGTVGDRLWVRETWGLNSGNFSFLSLRYFADDERRLIPGKTLLDVHDYWGKRPSIHMPRWASRITLEITGVRVERLQDISEADAAAEGVTLKEPELETYYSGFTSIWESINGPDSWLANPWVWVVEFRKVDQ